VGIDGQISGLLLIDLYPRSFRTDLTVQSISQFFHLQGTAQVEPFASKGLKDGSLNDQLQYLQSDTHHMVGLNGAI
jgi:hypothetical protein